MGDNTVGATTPAPKTNPLPPKKGEEKPKSRPWTSYLYAETVQALNSSSFAAGFLPVNNSLIKILVLGGYSNYRWPGGQAMAGKKVSMHSYKVEPQLQLNLFENSTTFLKKSQLFLRFQYDINQLADNSPLTHNLTTEFAHKFPGELFVLRADVFANNLQDPEAKEVKLAIAPFLKSPTYQIPLLKGIRFRIAPEYSYSFKTRKHGLLLHTKIEGDINSNPWAGWSVQTFWAVNVQGKKDVKAVDFVGLYLWFGSVLPANWFGPGFFFEGGIWMGKSALEQGPFALWKGFIMGMNLKFKWPSQNEARWWQ